MNCVSLLGLLLILQYRLSNAESNDWQNEIKQINSKLSDISTKISLMDKLSHQIDFVKLALDLINSKLDNSKRRSEEIEKNVKRISEICYGKEREVERLDQDRSVHSEQIEIKLSNKIDHYGNKMLREQQNMKNSSVHQTVLLHEIQNITVLGLNKMLTKLETLLVSFNQQSHLFTGISTKTKDLLTKSIEHESQLLDVEEKLIENEKWFKKSEENLKTYLSELWSNISKSLDEKRGDLSQKAVHHLIRAINQSKDIINLVTEIGGLLEPKVFHVTRLSEMLSENLKEKTSKDISSVVNNLTTALQTLKETAPSMMLSLSVSMNSLSDGLINLKNLGSNTSQCESDTIDEIRKHHAEISKYINSVKGGVKQDENVANIWTNVMNKLNNIPQKVSSIDDGNILQKLKEISREIKECRAMLDQLNGNSDEKFDTTFGK